MDDIKNIESRLMLLEENIQEIKEFIKENTGFYGFAKSWLKYYPTDLNFFFPEEVNYISKYFEKVLKEKKLL